MSRSSDEQVRRNRITREGWDLYRQHRERVTQLLVESSRPGATLCVFGAGNCNDLDLPRLRAAFDAIHLVDLDHEAMVSGCQHQAVANDRSIKLAGGIDVTGVASRMDVWRLNVPANAREVADVTHEAETFRLANFVLEPFDVVASVGLLTQLIEMVDLTLGTQHPQFLSLMTTIRIRHLRLLLESLRPGGKAWLFSEVVSSVTCPELLQASDARLMPILQRAILQQNFFTGINPAILHQLFLTDPELSASVASIDTPPPWLWTFFTRTYAVCAIGANKKA